MTSAAPEPSGGRIVTLAASRLTPDDPWPGLNSFAERDQEYFAARDDESAELTERVRERRLTLLYALSGLGKSSLVHAGLFPRLRAEQCLPISIRLSFADQAAPLIQQVEAVVDETLAAEGCVAPVRVGQETLWEFFHRSGSVIWSSRRRRLTPVLVFDQFEEMWTLGAERRPRECEELWQAIADLGEGRAPKQVKVQLDDALTQTDAPYDFRRVGCRVLLILREDYLASADELRTTMPSILQNRMRLKALNGRQALAVVQGPGKELTTEAVATSIVNVVAGQRQAKLPLEAQQVDPALLSLMCSELNKRRRAEKEKQIQSRWLERGGKEQILRAFYERCMDDVSIVTRDFVEQKLVLPSGQRDTVALQVARAATVPANEVELLIRDRLLRREERGGLDRIELAHDVLASAVQDSREQRRVEREAREHAEQEAAHGRKLALQAQERAQEEALAAKLAVAGARERVRRLAKVGAGLAFGVVVLAAWLFYMFGANRRATQAEFRSRQAELRSRDAARLSVALSVPEDPTLGAMIAREITDSRTFGLAQFALRTLSNPMTIRTFRGDAGFTSVAFCPDGSCLIAGSDDNSIRIWRTDGTAPPIELRRHTGPVSSVAVSPDGRKIVSGAFDGTVRVWQVQDGQSLAVLKAHADVRAVAFSPGGDRIAAATAEAGIQVWRVEDFSSVETPIPSALVTSLAYGNDGVLVAGSSEVGKGAVMVWRREDSEPSVFRQGSPVLAIASNGSLLAVAHGDKAVTVEATPDWGHGNGPVFIASDTPSSVAISSSGESLAVGSFSGIAELHDIRRRRPSQTLRGHAAPILAIAFSPNGQSVATASQDKTIRLWATTAPRVAVALGGALSAWSAAFSPDGRWVALGTPGDNDNDNVEIWNSSGEGRPIQLPVHNPVASVAFGRDGRLVAVGTDKLPSEDAAVQLWEVDGVPKLLGSIPSKAPVASVAFSPDGSLVVSGSDTGIIELWHTDTLATGGTLTDQTGGTLPPVSSVAFSGDGHVAAACEDNVARVWASNALARPVKLQHDERVEAVAFSPDSRHLVTGSKDSNVRIWDLVAGSRAIVLVGHKSTVTSVAFSPDGKQVASGSDDGTVKIWNADGTGRPLELRSESAVSSVSFSPDGERVLVTRRMGAAQIWTVNPDALLRELRAATPECLDVNDRRLLLGESEAEAEQASVRCGRSAAAQ